MKKCLETCNPNLFVIKEKKMHLKGKEKSIIDYYVGIVTTKLYFIFQSNDEVTPRISLVETLSMFNQSKL